jgi:hypothetical protein
VVTPSFHVRATSVGWLAGERATDPVAIVSAMSTSTRSHRLRTLLLLALAAGVAVALRAAVADKGGSYDPAEAAR